MVKLIASLIATTDLSGFDPGISHKASDAIRKKILQITLWETGSQVIQLYWLYN
jgi:hypothetical protein